jgi:glutaredoxin
MVKLYSKKGCAPCHTLKNYFDKRSIVYTSLDIDDNPALQQKVFDLVGMLIVPVVESDRGVVAGLNIPQILAIL